MKNKSHFALIGVLFLYGALSTAAPLIGAGASLAGKAMMAVGGLLLIGSSLSLLLRRKLPLQYGTWIMLGGLLLVESGAVANGLALHGTITPQHHILRILLSIGLIIWFLYERKKKS